MHEATDSIFGQPAKFVLVRCLMQAINYQNHTSNLVTTQIVVTEITIFNLPTYIKGPVSVVYSVWGEEDVKPHILVQ